MGFFGLLFCLGFFCFKSYILRGKKNIYAIRESVHAGASAEVLMITECLGKYSVTINETYVYFPTFKQLCFFKQLLFLIHGNYKDTPFI